MNGQQHLTNSSISANGTPSSSYPASLSSQSSRDGSPTGLTGGVRKAVVDLHYNWPTAKIETRGVHHSTAQPTGGFPTSKHSIPPNISLPVPISQSNNAFQSNNLYNRQPTVSNPSEILTSTKAPTQSSNQLHPQPYINSPTPQGNEIQQPPQGLTQPQLNTVHKMSEEPSQVSQPPHEIPQSSNQLHQLQNKFPQPSGQFSQKHNQTLQNQLPPQQKHMPGLRNQAHNQFTQLQSQSSQKHVSTFNNHISVTQNQISPAHKQFQPSQNQIPPHHNQQFPTNQTQVSPQHSQFLQPQNLVPPLHNQFSQSQNQVPPPNKHFPPSHIPLLHTQIPQTQVPPPSQNPPSLNRFPPSQNPVPLSNNQQYPPPLQNQLSLPLSNQVYNSLNQIPLPNNPTQALNHLNQIPGHIVSQQPAMQTQPYTTSQQLLPPGSQQFSNRYPQMSMQPGYPPISVDGLNSQMAGMTVQQGFNKMWGMDSVDLLKSVRDLLPAGRVEPPAIRLQNELCESANCSSDIFRCTLTKIPETKSLLDKSRLPLGVLIHPFKDLNQLSVVQCTVIVRCRVCRTYINPFVYFVDNKRWKCNLCFRFNELPDDFQFDPLTKTYGDPTRRPEIKSATIEFIAPSEYMVRPPQPAVYVFVMDVSRMACECGYLDTVCHTLWRELDNIPGDARTSVAFITFDSSVHFYCLSESQAQPHQLTVVDIDDMFLPTPENLLVNLSECRELIRDLLKQLPKRFQESYDTHSALGAALQAAYKLLTPTGGRVTVFQACLPNIGPGALKAREDPTQRAGENPPHLNPATDFYKKLALDCSGQQIAVDLFLVNSQYVDLATISGVSRFSGGCMHHIPLYSSTRPPQVDTLELMIQRYLTRKIGFESVMRLRCTRGMSIHTFHGNFFVRSTDLLSLPNANPDAGFGMQVSIDENLNEVQTVCFQAALLYTSSKGERRIRVHTLCLPIASNLADVMHSADQQCIAGFLAKMAVDRAVESSLSDAREAFFNVVADVLSAYKLTQTSNTTGCLLAPSNLRLLPLYILALLKHTAFRVGHSTRLDDRVFAMCQMKSLPLALLIQSIYPDLYCVLDIEKQQQVEVDGENVPQPPRLQLSSERTDSHGFYLLDDGSSLLLYVGHNLSPHVCQAVFNVPHFDAIPHDLCSLPDLDNPIATSLRSFISYLQNEKPFPTTMQILRDDSPHRSRFIEKLVEDKNESGISYYEFIQQIKTIMKS